MSEKQVFTVGEVAKIVQVAPRTVDKWCASGRLKGYMIPGTHTRRIPRKYLIKFLEDHALPLGELEEPTGEEPLRVRSDEVDLDTELVVRITPENAEDRIREAMHVIIHHWEDWEQHAGETAQSAQNTDAWFNAMEWQLGTVLQGMVFDDDR